MVSLPLHQLGLNVLSLKQMQKSLLWSLFSCFTLFSLPWFPSFAPLLSDRASSNVSWTIGCFLFILLTLFLRSSYRNGRTQVWDSPNCTSQSRQLYLPLWPIKSKFPVLILLFFDSFFFYFLLSTLLRLKVLLLLGSNVFPNKMSLQVFAWKISNSTIVDRIEWYRRHSLVWRYSWEWCR